MVANIVNIKVEEEDILGLDDEEESEGPKTTHPRDTTINPLKEKEEFATPRSKMDEEEEEPLTLSLEMGSNDVNNTPREISSTQFV